MCLLSSARCKIDCMKEIWNLTPLKDTFLVIINLNADISLIQVGLAVHRTPF